LKKLEISMPRVAVLGGGIAGCVLAQRLISSPPANNMQALDKVALFEREWVLGGLHRSYSIDGMTFDVGTFLFRHDYEIFRIFPRLLPLFVEVESQFGVIREDGRLDAYPMSLKGIRTSLGWMRMARCGIEILRGKMRYRDKADVARFSQYYLGETLYSASGLRAYMERLYQVPGDQITRDFSEKRLALVAKYGSLRQVMKKTWRQSVSMRNPLDDIEPKLQKKVLARPPDGFDKVYGSIGETLIQSGAELHLGVRITSIQREGNKFLVRYRAADSAAGSETEEMFDYIFSTIPLEILLRLSGQTVEVTPHYMQLFTLFYSTRGALPVKFNVIHNFMERGAWKRITNFSRYYGRRDGMEYFSVEGTLGEGVEKDQALLAARQDFEAFCQRSEVFPKEVCFLGGAVTPNAYPVLDAASIACSQEMLARIEGFGLFPIGRQGEFDYISSGDVAVKARKAADALLLKLTNHTRH
jgi:protoporphyrinogen oxidase